MGLAGRSIPGTTTRRLVTWGRLPFDGSAFARIATARLSPLHTLESGMATGLPLAAMPVVAVGRTALYLGDSDDPMVGVWRFDGRHVRSIRWEAAAAVPTMPDDRDRAFETDSAMWMSWPEIKRTKADFQRRLFAQMKELPLPVHLPFFTRVVPADDGGLWIERRARPWLESTEFLVADSTGAIVARVDTPSRLLVLQIGPDWVLGRFRTEDDVPLVQRYRVVR
jgi:hypothetical protein